VKFKTFDQPETLEIAELKVSDSETEAFSSPRSKKARIKRHILALAN
jgi:hypothetical protein